MKSEVQILEAKDFGIAEESAQEIASAFSAKVSEKEALAKEYGFFTNKEVSRELCVDAKALRLKLVKVRTGISAIHKTQKAFFLASGRFVDAWKNKETEPIDQMEKGLKNIETHYERIEAERLKRVHDHRESELKSLNVQFIPDNLGVVNDDAWGQMLQGAKLAYEQEKIDRAESERIRKEQEEIEQLSVKRKNTIIDSDLWSYRDLQGNYDELGLWSEENWNSLLISLSEKKRIHDEEIEAVRLSNEKLIAQREQLEKKLARDHEIAQAKIDLEHKVRLEAEAKLKLQEQLEAKRISDIEYEKEKGLSKGDAHNIKSLVHDLEQILGKYSFKSKKNKAMYLHASYLIKKTVTFIME